MSVTSAISAQNPDHFIQVESAESVPQEALLTKAAFWNAVHLQFKHLTDVFLKIHKNEQCIAINGRLVIECNSSTFVNEKNALLAAYDGLEIRSKKLKNRGVILSKGSATGPNSPLIPAGTDLLLRTGNIDNRRGIIESTEGTVRWISGRHAVLNNDKGTFFGKTGIVHQPITGPQLNTADPLNTSPQLLSNRQGKFTSEGLIDLHIPYIDNTDGLIQGNLEKLHTGMFINKQGRLYITQHAELTVDDLFDNEFGILEAAGKLQLHKGVWKNNAGLIAAPCGLEADIHEFINDKTGLIFTSCGAVNIMTESDQTQKGKIDSALGIVLLSQKGVVWGQNGRLITPQHVEIKAKQGRIELSAALIGARTLDLSALGQIDLSRMHVKVRHGLTAVSQKQWIDAHQIDLSEACGVLKFEAERYFNLENTSGSIGGTLTVHSRGIDLKNNDLVCLGDLDLHVKQFKSKNTSLTLPSTQLTLEAERFIHSESSHAKAPEGAIVESAGGWISKNKDTTAAASIRRQTGDLFIAHVIEEAPQVTMTAAKTLQLKDYEVDAQSLEIHSGGSTLVHEARLNADHIALKVDTLWLAEATLNFEQAKMNVEQTASLRLVEAVGETLKVKAKKGSVALQKNRMRVKRSALKAKKEISLTDTSVQGSVKLQSGDRQSIAGNLFNSGNFKAITANGDISFSYNPMSAMGNVSLEAPQGALKVEGVEIEADTLSAHGKTASLQKGRLRIRNKVDLQASHAALSDLQVAAQAIDVAGKELVHLDTVALKSNHRTSVSSEAVAYIQDSFVASHDKVAIVAESALIDKSAIIGETGDAGLNFAKGAYIDSSEVQAKNTGLKSEFAVVKNSVLKSDDTLALKGSFGFVGSSLESTRAIKAEGDRLSFKDARVDVAAGVLSTAMKSETIIDSHFAARNITQTSHRITAIHSSAVASEQLTRFADSLYMVEGVDQANQITLHSREQYLLGHHLQAADKIDLSSSHLDMSRSSLFGSLNARSSKNLFAAQTHIGGAYANMSASCDLIAPGMHLNSFGDVTLQAGGRAFLPDSSINASRHVSLTGNEIDRNRSILSAGSLSEQAAARISARNSHTTVSGSAYQDAGAGMLDLANSTTQAGSSLVRKGRHIYHHSASSSAWEHTYDSSELTNFGGRISLGSGNSHFTVDRLYNDRYSYMEGAGSLKIDISGSHVEQGNYHVGALEQTASSLTLAGNVQADRLRLAATHGDLTFNKSLNTAWGSFTAENKIVNKGNLKIQAHGDFKSRQMDNHGSIGSEGALSIDQAQFKEQDNVFARKELLFFSDSSIDTHRKYISPGTLGFISRAGHVHAHAPIRVGGDFVAQGNAIQLNSSLHADGQGVFKSEGTLHFNRSNASFGSGLFVDAKTVHNDAGHVEVHGSSHIRCQDFINSCVVETPKPQKRGKFFGRQEVNTAAPYTHTPATFWFHDDLTLEASNSVMNDASNLYADSLDLHARTLENRNRTHMHSYREAVGSYRNSFAGVSYGKKKTLYKDVNEEIVDGVGNIQVAKLFDLRVSGAVKNDGVVNADTIIGRMGSLDVGNFDNQANTQSTYSHRLKSLVGESTFRPGGEMRSQSGTFLQVEEEMRNRGFIESNGPVAIQAQTLLNKRYTVEQSEQVVVRKAWGRRGTKTVQTDHLDAAEASIHGSETHIFLQGDGRNTGGSITAVEQTTLIGKNFSNEALSLRKANRLKTGNVALWKKAAGHSIRTDFHPGLIGSGNTLDVHMEGRFQNSGSNVVGWGDTSVVAGSIEQKTLFSAPYKQAEKRTWNKSVDLHAINMQESQIVSVTGNTHVESTIGSVNIEGAVGSYGGSAAIVSARDISFHAQSVSVDNEISSVTLTPTSFTAQTTQFNTVQTSLPSFFAGGGDGSLVAKGSIQAEALQLAVENDLTVKAREIHFKPHKVVNRSSTSGLTAGVSFFGSQAIEAVAANQSPKAIGESLLREDPAIASVFDLARSKGGLSYAVNGLKAAAYSYNETAKFAKAYNQDNLGSSVGENLGITDLEGNFSPRVTVRVGSFDQESIFTQNIPTRLSVGGHMHYEATAQEYHGCEITRKGKGATFIGDKIAFKAAADSYSNKGSSMGLSLTVGPRGPAVGVDYSEQSAHGTSFQRGVQDFGDSLTIQANELNIQGVALEADTAHVAAKKIEVDSLVDTHSQNKMGISASTSGDFSFSYADGKSEQISTVAGIRAHRSGTLKADELNLNGALIDHIAIDAKKITSNDIHTSSSSNAFSISSNFKEIGNLVNAPTKKKEDTPPPGIAILGAFDFKSELQKGITRSTITGELAGLDGRASAEINRDPAKVQETGRKKRLHLGAPIAVINTEGVKAEAAEIKGAFDGTGRPRYVVQAPTLSTKAAADLTHTSLMAVDAEDSAKSKFKAAEEKPRPSKKTPAKERSKPVEVQNSSVVDLNVEANRFLTINTTTEPTEDTERLFVGRQSEQAQGELTRIRSYDSEIQLSVEAPRAELKALRKKLSAMDVLVQLHEAEETAEKLKQMADAHVLAKAFEWSAYPFEKAFEFTGKAAKAVCKSHPTLEKGCRKVIAESKEVYRDTKAFVVDHIPDSWKENGAHILKVHQESLLEAALFNEVHYQIPREMTFQYQQDCHYNTFSIATVALVNGFGPAARAIRGKTLVSPKSHGPIVGEIVQPGSKEARRAAMAKPVNAPLQLSSEAPFLKEAVASAGKKPVLPAAASSPTFVAHTLPEWALLTSVTKPKAKPPVDPRAIMSSGTLCLSIAPKEMKAIVPKVSVKAVVSNQQPVVSGAIAAWALSRDKSSLFPPTAQVQVGGGRIYSTPATANSRPMQMHSETNPSSPSGPPVIRKPTDREVYDHRIKNELKLVETLSKRIIPIKHSQSFPTIQEFLAKCEAHSFSKSKLGELKNGRISGQLLYLPVERGVIFLMKNKIGGPRSNPNILNSQLVECLHLKSHERVSHMVSTAIELAQSQGHKRIFMMWEPATNAVASQLVDDFKLICGMHNVPNPMSAKHYVVAEINVRHPAAEGAAKLLKKKLEEMSQPVPKPEITTPSPAISVVLEPAVMARKVVEEIAPVEIAPVAQVQKVKLPENKLTGFSKALLSHVMEKASNIFQFSKSFLAKNKLKDQSSVPAGPAVLDAVEKKIESLAPASGFSQLKIDPVKLLYGNNFPFVKNAQVRLPVTISAAKPSQKALKATSNPETLPSPVPVQEALDPQIVIENVVNMATAIPEFAVTIPKSMDVMSILNSPYLPVYGSKSASAMAAKEEFVNSVLEKHQIFIDEKLASRNATSEIYYAMDEQGEINGVIKEFSSIYSPQRGFVAEIVSLSMLSKANLKHSKLQKIQAIGKMESSDSGVAGLVLYDYIKGYTVNELFKLNPLHIPANQIGKALGEINAIHQSKPVDMLYLEGKTNWFKLEAQSILDRLQRLGLVAHFTMDDIENVIEGVKRNPGHSGLTLGDASVENVMIGNSNVIMIDTGTLMESVNVAGHPHGLPALDKHLMTVSMRREAIENSYATHTVNKLVDNFMVGYASQCSSLTPESELFAELFWEFMTIGGAKQNSLLLEMTLASVNAKFKSSEVIVQSEKLGSAELSKHSFSVYQLTGKHLSTKNDIFKDPVKSDVNWGDIESLVSHIGAEIIEGNGSRVKFVKDGVIGSFHRPHTKDTDKGALKSVRIFLENLGIKK